jgi:chromosome segregation ATPase
MENRIDEVLNLKKEVENNKIELFSEKEKLELEKSKISDDSLDEQIKKINEEINNINKSIDSYNEITTTNNLNKQHNDNLILEQENDKKEIEKLRKEKDTQVYELSLYEESITIFQKDFPNYIITTLITDIEKGMNDLLEEGYKGRYKVKIESTKTGIQIVYGKKDKDIKLAGGAEKNIFNLGFKNAFTKLANLKILILDEADSFMDTDVAKVIFTILNNKINNKELDQVFIITHKEEVKQLLQSDFKCKVFNVEEGVIT